MSDVVLPPSEPVRLTHKQGDTFDYTVEYTDGSVEEPGDPVDLTGYTAKFQMRRTPQDDAALVSLTETDGITITALSGRLRVVFATADFCGEYVAELEITSPAGKVLTLVEFVLTFTPETTR